MSTAPRPVALPAPAPTAAEASKARRVLRFCGDLLEALLSRGVDVVNEVHKRGHGTEDEAKLARKICRKCHRGLQLFTEEED